MEIKLAVGERNEKAPSGDLVLVCFRAACVTNPVRVSLVGKLRSIETRGDVDGLLRIPVYQLGLFRA